MSSRIVDMGHGVWVGNFEGCDEFGHGFPNVVHVWRDLNVTENRLCRCVREQAGTGLAVKWREGEPLEALSVPLDDLVAYMRRPGDILIHCAAGACRSPMLAVLAKVVRGDGVWGAIGHIYRKTWEERGFAPDMPHRSLKGVIEYRERTAKTLTLGCSFLAGRMDCLPRAVESVRPFVDRLYALVDERAPREVIDYLDSANVPWDTYRWCDDFSAAFNLAHDRLGTDWGLHVDTDEALEAAHGEILRSLAAEGEAAGVDGYSSPRRHWLDAAMTRESSRFPGDRQVRLRRKGFRFAGRVHQWPAPGMRVVDVEAPVIHHFNLALASPEELAGRAAYYERIGGKS